MAFGVLSTCFRAALTCCMLVVAVVSACRPPDKQEDQVVEIRPPAGSSISELIRNPVNADGQADTSNMPRFSFDHTVFDFGEIPDTQPVSHVFTFTNTGKTPLIIAHVRSDCGCTAPQWPKDPVPPGGTGAIEVRFDPTDKEGPQHKPVKITANTYPNTTVLTVLARVKPVK